MGNISSISFETIKAALRDGDCDVRAAAMNACQGKDVPLEVIKEWLRDDNYDVRAAAMRVCKRNGIEIPVSRTFEPPALVYKKCLGGVIVVAEIPADAHVRGWPDRKCRASKAIIKNIIGDFFGEQIGISWYDKRTTYSIGDLVEIDDFDLINQECSTGFHFFCQRTFAENYQF